MRTVRDAKLDNRTAREKLKPSGRPYWRTIDEGLHLGYRKGRAAGKWVIRRYLGGEDYETRTFAIADDRQPADGACILTFNQAQARARELAANARKPTCAAASGPFTVDESLDAYFSHLEAEGSKSLADARRRARALIRPVFGAVAVTDLTREQITAWRNKLAAQPRLVRGKNGEASRPGRAAANEDETRRRKATANRTLTILRAALNFAFRAGKVNSDAAWRAVKPFREVETARARHFSIDECRRLVNAAQGSFRDLVNAALFSGCRYGELCALRVRDFNPDSGTLFVEKSKSGKARHVVLTEEGQAFIRQLTAGRGGVSIMLVKRGAPWGPTHQTLPMQQACKNASIRPATFHTLRHTYASLLVMAGAPLPVVAQNLGHADTRMTERHYAHLAPSYLAEQIRRFAPTLGTVEATNVVGMGR
jgi:integrase